MAFDNTKPYPSFEQKVWLASPTMHGEELEFMREAFVTNWMSTVGKNINEIENEVERIVGIKHADNVALGLHQSQVAGMCLSAVLRMAPSLLACQESSQLLCIPP